MATGIVNPHALAAGPVGTAYRDAVLAVSPGPKQFYMLDEPFGTNTATDLGSQPQTSAYYQNDLTLAAHRGSTTIFGLPCVGNNTTGFGNGQMRFRYGSQLEAEVDASSATWSVSMLIRFSNALSTNYIVDGDYPPWYLIGKSTGMVQGRFKDTSNNYHFMQTATGIISSGVDYHLAMTVSNGTRKLYLNGSQVHSNNDGTFPGMNLGTYFFIGYRTDTKQLDAVVAGAAFWGQTLSSTDISNMYNAL